MTKVYVVRGRAGTKHCYHYDRECDYIKDNELRELSESEADAWEKDACKYCDPDYEVNNSGKGRSEKQVLRDAGFDVE